MLRDFEDCIEIEHGKRKFNFDKIYAVFNNELNDKNRLLSKLKDKNKVLKHQKAKLLRSVRQYMEDKEITGIKFYSRLCLSWLTSSMVLVIEFHSVSS